jgi:D-glycerate 3-kinase
VNERLGSDYQELFGYLDALVLLAAPSLEIVATWRKQQEHALRARLQSEGTDTSRVMTDAQIDVFVQHYERLTRHILTEMPARADVTVRLGVDRAIIR